MKKRITLLFLIVFCCFCNLYSQSEFKFLNKNKEQFTFKFINNLIVIPLEINGKQLQFILDTGVTNTILFNLAQNDSLGLRNVDRVQLQGLGNGEPIDALVSRNNKLRVRSLTSDNETVYVILKDKFDLSGKMGITIHGIIGHNLLKDVIVKINYKLKRITLYNPETFSYSKCSKCEVLPLEFNRRKPYIDVKVQLDTIGNKLTDVKMLIDSGGSDALWLFEHSKENILTPKRFFDDILGEGLSGTIYGKRSRIPEVKIGRFNIKKPTVSFLDTLSSFNARNFRKRNGSIGGNILKRFKIWLDYPNKKITLKKSGSFKGGFDYNMSGLYVVYNGKQLVKEQVTETFVDNHGREVSENNSISFITRYFFKFKPSFIVNKVVKNSPADRAGVLKGDIILKINGKQVYELKLKDITYLLQERDKKKIKLQIERNGKKMKFEFRLEKKV